MKKTMRKVKRQTYTEQFALVMFTVPTYNLLLWNYVLGSLAFRNLYVNLYVKPVGNSDIVQ